MQVRNVGILGTGLIGASCGLALRERGARVAGWDPQAAHLETALRRGALDAAGESEDDVLLAAADLLIVAAPPTATRDLVARLDHSGLVIDVAGVKAPIVMAARAARFVGTHPMAGREVAGPEAASAALFRGAAWVVVTDGAAAGDVELVSGLVTELGARPILMDAARHDAAVAAVSHVPQLIAAALVAAAGGAEGGLELAAGGFRDLTRVAASDPRLWVDLLRMNSASVVAALDGVRTAIDELAASVEGDGADLETFLAAAMEMRRAMTARVATVRVALADEPGELARVGQALQASAVDVRDIQLRHAPHGGGGVLTLSVRPGDGEALRHAVEREGLLVVD